MFEISVQGRFSSAHRLPGYRGACRHLHGHNWEVEVTLRGARLNSIGMLVDFGRARLAVRRVLRTLDHRELNRLPALARTQPTAENLARHIYRALARAFRKQPWILARVRVSESPGSVAAYWEEPPATGGGNQRTSNTEH